MPPVMGAAAFLIATFLGLPYAAVVLAALGPAILYYVGLFMQIDLEAAKQGIRGLPFEEIPSFKRTMLEGWLFIIPVLVIIYTLFVIFADPDMAGLYAAGSAFAVAMCKKASRLNTRKLLAILEKAGEALLDILVIAAVAGLVIGVVFLTGLGFAFSQWLSEIAGANLFLLLAMVAVAAIVLGMGMTVTAAYIIVAILLAPALVQVGVDPLLAHLFIFYFAVMSFVTPPISVAAYTAASIANSGPLRTAFQAMRLGIVAYLVPFAFVFNPALVLKGTPVEIISSVVLAVLGVITVAVGLEGYLRHNLDWFTRTMFFAGGIGLLSPIWVLRGIGVAIILLGLFIQWRRGRSTPAMAPG